MVSESLKHHPPQKHRWRPQGTSYNLVRISIVTMQPADTLDTRRCMAMLPSDECLAAERMSPGVKARFLQCRTILRMLLGEVTGKGFYTDPFLYGPHGKPSLPEEDLLQFNLSHSGELAVFAVAEWKSKCAHIGVDVERMHQRSGAVEIARRFFHPEEIAYLTSTAIEEREAEFLRIWVRKEAFVKAMGADIEGTLAGFSAYNAMDPVSREDSSSVWLYDFRIGMSAVAALASTQPLDIFDVGPLSPAATWLHQLHKVT